MADVSTWSTTAASNNSASPDGWPENMLPSGVNNSARENMAQVATWRQKFGAWMLENIGLTATVGGGNLTVTLRVKDGSTSPSTTNKVGVSFRNATLTTGGFSYVEATSGIDVTLLSGGTLGFASSESGYIFVYAINNAGTMELALSGSAVFDEGIVHSTTGIGTGSDSSNVLYSTSNRTDIAIRLIGRITIQHGAGTWTNSPTAIALWSPELFISAPSGYVSGSTEYIRQDGGSTTTFDVSANVTESTFESVGPTGSGATNIWTAMDTILPGTRIAIIRCSFYAQGDESATNILGSVYVRMTGDATAASNANRINRIQKDNNNLTEVPEDANLVEVKVPLDSTRSFDITWSCVNDAAVNINLYLVGFIA